VNCRLRKGNGQKVEANSVVRLPESKRPPRRAAFAVL